MSLAVSSWQCLGCETEMIGTLPPSGKCYRCELREILKRPASRLDRKTVDRVPRVTRPEMERAEVLRASGFPADYCEAFNPEQLRDGWPTDRRHPDADLRQWAGERPYHLVLLKGPVGVGKTFLASQLAFQGWLSGKSIGYVMAGDIATLRWQRRDQLLKQYGVLVVDDLDRGPSGAAWNPTFELIHGRQSDHLATIATINSTFERLYELNAALTDRFRRGLVLTLKGESQR